MMGQAHKLVAVVAVVLALVAGATLPCFCASMSSAAGATESHGCCPAPDGPQLTAPCCGDGHAENLQHWAAPTTAAPLSVASHAMTYTAHTSTIPLARPAPSRPVGASPPLRI